MKRIFFAEILTIGDELLKGSTLNTNAQFLGKELTDLGFRVQSQNACPDNLDAIQQKIESALRRSDLVILTGGLGPTPDDLTRDAIAEYFEVPLIFSKSQFSRIRELYRSYGKKIPSIVRKEAMFPRNAHPLINRFGVALGFYVRSGRSLMVVLPGVPKELEKMYFEQVRTLIRKEFRNLHKRYALVAKTVGLSEPEVMKRLGRDFFDLPFDFGIYPQSGEVSLRIYADQSSIIKKLKQRIKKRLTPDLYALQDESLAKTLGDLLTKYGKTLAVVESCTGGRLAQEITQVAGASRYFKGGVVAYSNEIKEKILGVSKETLKKFGAVSMQTAESMALGVCRLYGTDYALAVTGVAGPGGGTKEKPVGRVCVALAAGQDAKAWQKDFWGDRGQIQSKSVTKALEYLWRDLHPVIRS